MSNERLFWVALVAGMVMSRVADGSGLLHRMWPERFDPPARCEKVALGEFRLHSLPAHARIAQAATENVAQGVA